MKSSQPATAAERPIESAGEAQKVISHLESIMDSLLGTLEEETALVRGGHLHDAMALEEAKAEYARAYVAESGRIKQSRAFIGRALPEALAALRRRHDNFHALLQINLTVLATAHAVSEGIIRGVSGELARKRAPQTYGASGRANVPGPKVGQPLAVSRVL